MWWRVGRAAQQKNLFSLKLGQINHLTVSWKKNKSRISKLWDDKAAEDTANFVQFLQGPKVICCKCVNGGTDPFCGRVRLSHLSKHCLSLCKLKFVQSHTPTVAVSYLKVKGDNVHLNIQISAAEASHTARCWSRMPLAPILLRWVKGDASCCPFLTCGFLCGLLDWAAALQKPPQPQRYSLSAADRTSSTTKRACEPQTRGTRARCEVVSYERIMISQVLGGADWFDAYQIWVALIELR